jgi:ABC-2 type transport system permease protein
MTAFWLSVLWGMASQLYWEKETGNLQLYLASPMSRMALLAGMAVGAMFSAGVRALSTLLLGIIIFNVQLTITEPLLLAMIFLVTLVAIYGMGMLFASLFMLYGRDAWNLSNLLQEPIYLVSGFYFPVANLGFWVAMIASVIPITLGLDGMRQLMFGPVSNGFLPVMVELAILIALAVGFLVLAHYALRYMEELGRKEGRLTLRWQ